MRETDTAALQHVAFLDQSRNATTAFGAFPGITNEALAIDSFDRRDDVFLKE